MKRFLLILIISLISYFAYCQENVWGIYFNNTYSPIKLDLRPNKTYIYFNNIACSPSRAIHDTGNFKIMGDTIFLISNRKKRKQKRFLILTETVKHKIKSWPNSPIAEIYENDITLWPDESLRISDKEAIFPDNWIKSQGYFDNGKINYSIEYWDKIETVSNYYESGQIKSIEKYFKNKKSGDCYYYKENGELDRIETYRRGKLKRTFSDKVLLYW